MRGWDSVVGVATELQNARQSHYVSILGNRNRKFYSQKQPKLFCATYNLLFSDYLGIVPGSKVTLDLKLTTPSPIQVDVKSNWSYTATPSFVFVACSGANLP